jgi:hypothetical protein
MAWFDIDQAPAPTIKAFVRLPIDDPPRLECHAGFASVPPGALCSMVDLHAIYPDQDDPPPVFRETSKEVHLVARPKPISFLHPSTHPAIAKILPTKQIHETFLEDQKKSMK